MKLNRALLAAVLVPAFAAPVLAHTGHAVSGVSVGFVHPFSGLDHVLVMVAVGVFAAQLGGRALYLVPSAFVGMMALGGAAAMAGLGLPMIETGIALSVLVMGLAVAQGWRLPPALAAALVGVFAVFHGQAHGAEMPVADSGLAYGAGFVVATALLHGFGIGLGLGLQRMLPRAQHLLGVLMAAAGISLLAGWA